MILDQAEAVLEAAWDAQERQDGAYCLGLVFWPLLVGLALLAGVLDGLRRACEEDAAWL